MMRYTQAEKMEIIRTVEESKLPVQQTLRELDVPRSSFYEWYARYERWGYDGLAARKPETKQFWNRIPDHERQQVVSLALAEPEKTPRELAWTITDRCGYFLSESSVYRILKAYDLVPSPAYIVMTAADEFTHKTTRVHELWQTDFTYLKVTGWGWYYLASVLDDFSRFIIAWKLFTSMETGDVKELLDEAIDVTGVEHVAVRHRPRLLTDNGPCYISGAMQEYLEDRRMEHTRGAPYHPMTQGKIERYHRTMKNVITLQHYYLPGELEREIGRFIDHYNNRRYHESLNNVTPADVYFGRQRVILTRREQVKRKTLKLRKQQNLALHNPLHHNNALNISNIIL
jgi:transposase InsO family protein